MAEILQRLERFSPVEIRLGLEPIRRLLAALDHPERALPCIHVAGTNGKGSTVAFLEAILGRAGHGVGCYTSPHLERFNERLRWQGAAIDDDTLIALLERMLVINGAQPATFFELTTAAALEFMAARAKHHPSPAVVLETGLGGRLDATNVVEPRVAVITPIGLDHQAFLGDTITAIAGEKAGILKPGVPAVADARHPQAVAVIRQRAAALGLPLWLRQEDFSIDGPRDDGSWTYRDPLGSLVLPPPTLAGPHQYGNAALAIAVLRLASRTGGWTIPDPAWAAGVVNAWLPGRLERFPGPPPLWLDGAHNPPAARVLAEALTALGPGANHLLFAAMADKDLPGVIAPLAGLANGVEVVALDNPRAAAPERIAPLWAAAGVTARCHRSVAQGLEAARQACPAGGRVVVCGSLYLVGAVRSLV
ncbi:MAG: bifunctional folylpolyglutamate synthase/dihydrofolate synthase [Magnetococcales bacterium]|nr:bifunctional folylpolyglutamate synthase/dihydrofolate synthase [Magnetococcales bacterium]